MRRPFSLWKILSGLACLPLLSLLLACGTATSSTSANQLKIYPDTGPAGLPFYDPQGLCLDSQNHLYVADGNGDQSQYRLLKLSLDGKVLGEWHYFQPVLSGNVAGPIGVACDRQGEVYVSDASSGQIIKLSSTGQLLALLGTPGQFSGINVLALDQAQNLYVSEYSNSRIEKFSSSGQLLTTLSLPAANAHPAGPIGIAVDSAGTIYVADQRNNRIIHLSPTGSVIQSWGEKGSAPGQFNHPGGLTLDSQGNLSVGDDYNNRIETFSPQGKLLTLWSLPTKTATSLNTGPGPMTSDTQNNIYVSDTDPAITTWHIRKYSSSGTLLATI